MRQTENPALGRTRPEGFVVPPSFAAPLARGGLEGCVFTPGAVTGAPGRPYWSGEQRTENKE
jgi:hypothetical protein